MVLLCDGYIYLLNSKGELIRCELILFLDYCFHELNCVNGPVEEPFECCDEGQPYSSYLDDDGQCQDW